MRYRKTNSCNREGQFIKKLLNQFDLKARISVKTVQILTSIIRDLTVRIVKDAFHLCEVNIKKTLTPLDIQTSVRLNFPGELATHAVSLGVKSVASFSSSRQTGLVSLKPVYFKNKVKQMNYRYRISKLSMVYLSSVIEYILIEILDLTKHAAINSARSMLTPRDLFIAIKMDEELSKLFEDCVIPSGGVVPSLSMDLNLQSIKNKPKTFDLSSFTSPGFDVSKSVAASTFGTPVASTGFGVGNPSSTTEAKKWPAKKKYFST